MSFATSNQCRRACRAGDHRDADEYQQQDAIHATYGLPATQSDQVTVGDRMLLATERRDLMPADGVEWPILNGVNAIEKRIVPVNHHRTRAMFHQRILEVTLK